MSLCYCYHLLFEFASKLNDLSLGLQVRFDGFFWGEGSWSFKDWLTFLSELMDGGYEGRRLICKGNTI